MKSFSIKVLLAFSALFSCSMIYAQIDVETPPLKLISNSEAKTWVSEAYPIGNGYMGAMIFGGVASDVIQINEHTIWSGGPGKNPAYNGGHSSSANIKANLQTARQALQDKMTEFSKNDFAFWNSAGTVVSKDYAPESAQLKNNINALTGNKSDFGSYQTLGNINMVYPDAIQPVVINYDSDARSSNPNENIQNLFDGTNQSKWYADNGFKGLPCFVAWEYDIPKTADSYSLVSGNDMPTRDPKSWKLYGSNTSMTAGFTLLDTRTNQTFSNRHQARTFNLSGAVTYKYYKLEINEINGAAPPQLSQIILNNSSETPSASYSDYNRTLDIDNAIATVSYTQNGVNFSREYFMSYPHNVMAIRLTADQTGKLNRTFWISTPQPRVEISAANNVITMTGSPSDHTTANRLKFAQQLKIIPVNGTLTTDAITKRITVENADEIILLMSAATNYVQCMDETFNYFSSADPLNAVEERMNAASLISFETLKDAHIQDYKSLYDRMALSLGVISAPDKTTRQLLVGMKNNTNSTQENRYLEMLYYQFGRYLLIACSRPNTLPANLQGVWAENLQNPWDADYHTNINLQMNYWLAQQTNLAECHLPMVEYVKSLVPRGKQTAKHYYCRQDGKDVRGWVIHHENNIWGNTAPGNWYEGFYFPAAAAWVCQDIWEYYLFNSDKQFLEENYQILLDAALFWVDNLWKDGRDGSLVANPSYSPEHGAYSLGASCDQAIIWELFDFVIKASEILDKTSSELEEVKTAKNRLAGPQIGLAGQFMEWKDEVTKDITGDNNHRHTNHLFWLHPGSQIVAGQSVQDSLYTEAMKKTLNTRNDKSTGWSMAWKVNFWARLRDGNRAHNLLKWALNYVDINNSSDGGEGGVFSNLLDVHPSFVFQIDGNFGTTAGMCEMLVQSQGNCIDLLPALPDAWNTGSCKGIKARGNFEINARWNNGQLQDAEITSNSGNPCILKYKGIGNYKIVEKGGGSVPFDVSENKIFFETQTGKTYYISR